MFDPHRHSEGSLLDGVGTAQQWASRAAEMGRPALSLTDHGTMRCALHHIKACRDNKIFPVVGVEAYYREDRHTRDSEQKNVAYHLVLLARNKTGFKNLMRITSESFATGFYNYPCVDLSLLREYPEGIVCTTGCINSYVNHLFVKGDYEGAENHFLELEDIYGDCLFGAIQPHDLSEQRETNLEIVNLCERHGHPVVAEGDAHVPYREWVDTYAVNFMLGTGSNIDKAEHKKSAGEQVYGGTPSDPIPTMYFMDEKEMLGHFEENHPDLDRETVRSAIKASDEMLQLFSPIHISKRTKLPKITQSEDEAEKIIREWMVEGMQREMERWRKDGVEDIADKAAEYWTRVESEMDILKSKGVLDYFLLVGKTVRWAKSEHIRTGLGRGSAAGCLVSYLIGITAIDPIAYGLLFERFLNPNRKGLPDIDLDFDAKRRHEVKDWLASEFGEENVSDIAAYGTYQPKAVIKDVSRVFCINPVEVDAVTKTINIKQTDDETTIEEIRPFNDKLDEFLKAHPDVEKHALRLEGQYRNASKHAAGVVITDRPVTEYMPLERDSDGGTVTAWSGASNFDVIGDFGFVKLDVLGVWELTKHEYICQQIRKRHGQWPELNDLPALRDPHRSSKRVLKRVFEDGKTLGVFQFTGQGITGLLKHIKPDWMGDIVAANALYRPGAMETAFDYGDRKRMPADELDYWHESIIPFMSETYGIVAYQEQVMEICKALGNFTPGEADDMRKAMGKLYRLPGPQAKKFMQGFYEQWMKGCRQNGLTDTMAKEIWSKVLRFAGYGFNKSHSASYSLEGYQDGFLKLNWPPEFYAGALTYPPASLKKKEEKIAYRQSLIREGKLWGVQIAPPDINESAIGFTLSDDRVRVGFEAIHQCGKVAADTIIFERKENGPFEDYEDFCERVPAKKCNKTVKEALRLCGAFDRWGMRGEYDEKQRAFLEKEYLNVAITGKADYEKYVEWIEPNIITEPEFDDAEEDTEVVVGGEVVSVKTKNDKNKREMAWVEVAFGPNTWRCTVFSYLWEVPEIQQAVRSGSVMIAGTKDVWKGRSSVRVTHIATVEEYVNAVMEA